MDRRHTSLSAQAAQLQRSIQNREQRRIAEKAQRHEAAEAAGEYGAYDDPAAKRQAVGSGARSGAVAKLSEISALASRPVEVLRCDLCQATFPSQAQYQQHLAGPVHRKAVDRQMEQQLAAQRRAVYQDMTESALGAAAWAAAHGGGGGGGGGRHPAAGAGGGAGGGGGMTHGTVGPGGGGGRGGGEGGRTGGRTAGRNPPGGGGRGDGGPAAPRSDVLSHEEMVAAATRQDEPLTIDGWAPPTITLAPPKPAAPSVTLGTAATAGQKTPSSVVHQAHDEGGAAAAGAGQQEGSGRQGGEGGPGSGDGEEGQDGGGGPGLLGLAYGSDDEDADAANEEGAEGQGKGERGPGAGAIVGKAGKHGDPAGDRADEDSGSSSDGEGGGRFTGSFF